MYPISFGGLQRDQEVGRGVDPCTKQRLYNQENGRKASQVGAELSFLMMLDISFLP